MSNLPDPAELVQQAQLDELHSRSEEKIALEWLEWVEELPTFKGVAAICTLKAMLAEPRMLRAPDQETINAMAAEWFRGSATRPAAAGGIEAVYGTLGEALRRAWQGAYDHLTKPKTKTQWAVGVGMGFVHFDTFADASKAAETEANAMRIVTIQRREVPA